VHAVGDGEAQQAVGVVAGQARHRDFVRALSVVAFARFGRYDLSLPQLLGSRGVHAWIAEADGCPVGFALYRVDVPLAEGDLLAIAVEPAWHRRGVGRRLLAAVEHDVKERCPAHERPALRLTVAGDNAAARALFEGAGFRYVPGDEGIYPEGQHALGMLKAL